MLMGNQPVLTECSVAHKKIVDVMVADELRDHVVRHACSVGFLPKIGGRLMHSFMNEGVGDQKAKE